MVTFPSRELALTRRETRLQSGSLWRTDSGAGDLKMVADGLTDAVDIAVAGDGTIDVAKLFERQISMISGGAVASVVENLPTAPGL